ncbi:MAG: hypothetical protein PUP93_23595 [Rhizonema sp. NSF051]|nr:hypothetical protein [Rhizonema sp. NSF051]
MLASTDGVISKHVQKTRAELRRLLQVGTSPRANAPIHAIALVVIVLVILPKILCSQQLKLVENQTVKKRQGAGGFLAGGEPHP